MNAFLAACGTTVPLSLNVECQGVPDARCLSFDTPFVLVGRDPCSDLQLPQAAISDRHAYLQMVGGKLFFVDLGSRQGIYLAGKRRRSGEIDHRQAIRVGPYRIRRGDLDEQGLATDAASRPDGEDSPLSRLAPSDGALLTLELTHRSLRSSLCSIHDELVLVGSAADCQVRVLDPSVSNYHCSLLRTPTGLWVIDLLGRGGVSVNGTSVRYAKAHEGDVLHLGHSQIRIHLAHQTTHAKTLISRNPRLRPESSPPDVDPSRVPLAAAAVPRGNDEGEPVDVPRTFPESGACLARLAPHETVLLEEVLAPLTAQFNLMQQQLVDQFQQAGMMLFDTFSALHQEHLSGFREELAKLRRINEELDTTRAELASSRPSSTLNHVSISDSLADAPTAPASPSSPVPSYLPVKWDGRGRDNDPGADQPTAGRRVPPRNGDGPAPATTGTEAEAATRADQAPGQATQSDRKLDADVHSLLYQRITTLRDEQQSRWRRVLGLVSTRKALS